MSPEAIELWQHIDARVGNTEYPVTIAASSVPFATRGEGNEIESILSQLLRLDVLKPLSDEDLVAIGAGSRVRIRPFIWVDVAGASRFLAVNFTLAKYQSAAIAKRELLIRKIQFAVEADRGDSERTKAATRLLDSGASVVTSPDDLILRPEELLGVSNAIKRRLGAEPNVLNAFTRTANGGPCRPSTGLLKRIALYLARHQWARPDGQREDWLVGAHLCIPQALNSKLAFLDSSARRDLVALIHLSLPPNLAPAMERAGVALAPLIIEESRQKVEARRIELEQYRSELSSIEADLAVLQFNTASFPKRGREHITKAVQREVWRRDQGRCVECGSQEKLHFDHIIPVSKGGSGTPRNIQLLCEKYNLAKSDDI